jgi:formate dehydrogenase subunit delta
MHVANLVVMANQIGKFYESVPDRDEALASTASHLRRFWDPRMRLAMLANFALGGGGHEPFTLEAIQRHRATWEPKVARSRPGV